MDQKELVSKLRQAAKDPVANAVFHVLALRERTRKNITVSGLSLRMSREKYKYSNAEYAQVLKTLAQLGLGVLQTDAKGRPKALREIKISLQSVGRAALNDMEATEIKAARFRNRYGKIINFGPPLPEAPKFPGLTVSNVSLRTQVNGKKVIVEFEEEMSGQEIAEMINRLGRKVS